MGRRASQVESERGKVRRLYTDRDLASASRSLDTFPAYHDPIFQLVGVSIVFVVAFAASLIAAGNLETLFQSVVIASGVLGSVVLLRSVRHGWNVGIYGRARQASWREATFRMERNLWREAPIRCAELLDEDAESAINVLQSLTEEAQCTLARIAPSSSIAVIEETRGRFLVLSVAGYIERRPFDVGQGKSCLATQPFSSLLSTFARQGRVIVDEVQADDRRFWVGLVAKDPDAELDPEIAKAIGSWVRVLNAMEMLPRSRQRLLRAG